MVTLLGALLGFFTSIVPSILKLLEKREELSHERELWHVRLSHAEKGAEGLFDLYKSTQEFEGQKALYKHAGLVHIRWVDALSASVRPVITYIFFFLYVGIKVFCWGSQVFASKDWGCTALWLWTEEDYGLFAAVVSFWFGQRLHKK